MKIKKIVNRLAIGVFICLIMGIILFLYDAAAGYNINKDFASVPLNFNPYNSSSSYKDGDISITVNDGFVKGIQKGKNGEKDIVVRALSPLPEISVKCTTSKAVSFIIENINPDFYIKSIEASKFSPGIASVNSVKLNIDIKNGQTITINPKEPDSDSKDGQKFIVLGDNRDGYDTFNQIIQQVNAENPAFVIDNGDLVFSGKPNQYRLFDKMASGISSTLCTTLGNHDIRGNGRNTYKMLYGPAYYSFDFSGDHFVFLDSSPGWSEKRAISEEQYVWLENDLIKAQGKKIFVVTHIPPEDPRTGVTKNEIPNYVGESEENGNSWLEQKLNNYSESKSMNHGFQDPLEAAKFENLMSEYHVSTVYLSHIHSYLEYTKDGVRYLITGGAGAELLTKDSYYHYLIAKTQNANITTIVELPSPANNYISRYLATAQLFANAMYEENPAAVVFIISGFVLLALLLIIKLYLWKKEPFETFGKWLYDVGKFAVKHFKELFS